METKFNLPEAPNFTRYLLESLEGLTTSQVVIPGRKETKINIFQNNLKLGTYHSIDRDSSRLLFYCGKVPGHNNLSGSDMVMLVAQQNPDGSYERKDYHSRVEFP